MNEVPASDGRRWLLSLLLLTFATGLVDAASVLGLGHVFTGNMTGNLLFLGFSLAGANEVSIAASLLAVAGFIAGAAWGGRIAHGKGRRPVHRGFAIELALLIAALVLLAFTGPVPMRDRTLLVLLAAALGIQGAVARRAGSDFSTVVLTSTLLRAATDTARKHAGQATLRRAVAIAAMVAGAVIGALLLHLGLAWPIVAAALLVAIALSLSWSAAAAADR